MQVQHTLVALYQNLNSITSKLHLTVFKCKTLCNVITYYVLYVRQKPVQEHVYTT